MNFLVCFFLLANLPSLDNLPINPTFASNVSNAQSGYEKHLPRAIYEYLIKNNLLDEACSENNKEKQNLEGVDRIRISIQKIKGQQCVGIEFCPGNRNAEDNFGGVALGYRNGKLMAYVVFDADMRDYVVSDPFSKTDEEEAKALMLALLEGGVAKIKEEN